MRGLSNHTRLKLWLRTRSRQLRRTRFRSVALRVLSRDGIPDVFRHAARFAATQDLRPTERWPNGDQILTWLEQEWQPALALAACRVLAYEGRLNEAIALAEQGRDRALENWDFPDVLGSFTFQLADSHRTAGAFDLSEQISLTGHSALASTVMAMWQEFSRIAAQVAQGARLGEGESIALARLRVGHPPRQGRSGDAVRPRRAHLQAD